MARTETRLVVLGTQGWIPTARRQTTCVAYRCGPRLLLFDAGTGLSRLLQLPGATLLERAEEVHLFLSHYHLDHVCGLAYLGALLGGRGITLHVPDEALSGVDPLAAAPRLLSPPFHPTRWGERADYALAAVHAGDNRVGPHSVQARAQRHAGTTVAYRVDDSFVFATDTVADEATAEFARGAELLLHEAWIDGREEQDTEKAALVRAAYAVHSSARQAAALAAAAGVAALYLIHLNPLFDETYYDSMESSARLVFPPASVPPDLQEHRFRRD